MKKWKVYKVYAEDYKDVYRMIIPAPNKKEAEYYASSGGLNIVKTTEVEDLKINTEWLCSFLTKEGFDTDGIDVICRAINMIGLNM